MTQKEAILEMQSYNMSSLPDSMQKAIKIAIRSMEDLQKYREIGSPEQFKEQIESEKLKVRSHDEKQILHYSIELMRELTSHFEQWYRMIHGDHAVEELSEEDRFGYQMSYFSIVQELFLFNTFHSGGTSTREKCRELGVNSSEYVTFAFQKEEEEP